MLVWKHFDSIGPYVKFQITQIPITKVSVLQLCAPITFRSQNGTMTHLKSNKVPFFTFA